MTAVAAPTQYTPAEIERLSWETGKSYELVDGELVEKHAGVPMSMRSTTAAAEVVFHLRSAYPRSKAYLFVEQPTYCFNDPGHMRKPDVALVWSARLPNGPDDGELRIAPDFVAEVVSPTNTFDVQLDRIAEYLDAGVALVWLVQPRRRWVQAFRRNGPLSLYRTADTINDDPLLPGFSVPVAELFPAAAATTNTP